MKTNNKNNQVNNPLAPLTGISQPLAITMWDFSWLERRWPGAGYENWDLALDELAERGYNAVRIDAFPHLIDAGAEQEWELEVLWTVQDWGSPAPVRVRVWPALPEFIRACAQRGIRVALSSWFRKDTTDVRSRIQSHEDMARIWIKTLQLLEAEGLVENLLYVDLCNEWPGELWAPFFVNTVPEIKYAPWSTPRSLSYMQESIALVRSAFPLVPLTYSFCPVLAVAETLNLSYLDFFEPHIWAVQSAGGTFYKEVGYDFELLDPKGYYNLQKNGERLYRSDPSKWQQGLISLIQNYGSSALLHQRPLITTECWGPIDYKDWPMLDWGWVKELCDLGVRTASATGRWAAISTSNFCGPQFRGIWRDVQWHQQLTQIIRSTPFDTTYTPKGVLATK